MSKVVDTVTDVLNPILKQHHFNLFDVNFVKESQKWYLRVYIDKPGGITINDCALISDELGQKLDEMDPDPIPQAYYLDVSSPGAERPLRNIAELKQAINEYIHVSLYYNVKKQKVYEGTFKKMDHENIVLEYNHKGQFRNITIPIKAIAKARLAIKF
ncbi:ribosome maturation factor RimP [Philodulcilactobacillus myokoensis]|uniref:Ribosome maturation factor RimP n=1 Tax=Philodulcilactobacillus myokoensis TaxID=2929573 RepID=A0A9W6B188_9LACO|nr:ribosome maturation factor RimP [Philodulcilactobacillus myokoensis]GLB46946.1 ribosome maturation factor RimP [Philodulcilactobacillus myokoensis]